MAQATLAHPPRPTVSPRTSALSLGGGTRERMYEGRVLVGGGGLELPEPSPLSTSYPMVIKEIPFKCSTCKTRAGFIKEIPYKMQHVQD